MLKNISLFCALIVMVVLVSSAAGAGGNPNDWLFAFTPGGPSIATAGIGAKPGCADGYDDQPQTELWDDSGIGFALYRESGSGWSGPPGLYHEDFESPIPAGGSKTWWNIILWAQNYTVPTGHWIELGPESPIPSGYTANLVLDYVPEACNWTGPMSFDVDMTTSHGLILPIATVENPLQGTRMHLTVYAPVPEPSSLAALAFGLLPIGAAAIRRRRR